MNYRNKNILSFFSGLLLGGVFLYFTLRNKPLVLIWDNVINADLFWIIPGFPCLFLIFYLRALRWQILLEESGQKLVSGRVFTALLLGFFVNSFTPKLGEIVRCTTLRRNSGVPVPSALGTVVAERVYDLAVLLIGLLGIVFWEFQQLKNLLAVASKGIFRIYDYKYFSVIMALSVAIVILLVFFVLQHKNIRHRGFQKIVNFFKEMYMALGQGFRLKRASRFLFLTALIWILLVILNLCYLKALPDCKNVPLLFSVVVLFVGGIGWALPAPGGIGTTHFFVLQLFLAYGLNSNAGISFGLLSNGLTFLFTLLLGVYALMRFEIEKKR